MFFPMAHEKGVGVLARVPLASGLLTGKFKPGQKFEEGDHRRQGIPGETFSGVGFKSGLDAVEELKSLQKSGERSLAQLALSFTLSYDGVTSSIPGAVRREQVLENAKASDLPRLNQNEKDQCATVYEKYFKKKMEKMF